VDFCLLIKQRLEELGLGQKDLAAAAEVTESYISQLLTRKKPPPAPDQSDIYERMAELLKLPRSHLSELADAQRTEVFKSRPVVQGDSRADSPQVLSCGRKTNPRHF
jgi:transcriptional regulator with XRE-family HTH domain